MPSERAIMAEIFGREQIAPEKRAALEDVVRKVAASAGIVLESDRVLSADASSPDAEEAKIRADMARRAALLVEAQRQYAALTAEIARLKAVAEQATHLAKPPVTPNKTETPAPPPRPEKRPPAPPRSAKPTPPKSGRPIPRSVNAKATPPPPVASSSGEFRTTLADFGLPQVAPTETVAPPSADLEESPITALESVFDDEQPEVNGFAKEIEQLKRELEKFPDNVKAEIESVVAETVRLESAIVGPGLEPDHNQVQEYRTWLKAGIDANRALQDLYETTASRLRDFFEQLIEKTKDTTGRSSVESRETEIEALFAKAVTDKKITTKGKKKAWYNKKGVESNYNVIHGIWKRSSELSAENYYDRYEAEKRLAALHSEYLTALTAYATELKALYSEEPVS